MRNKRQKLEIKISYEEDSLDQFVDNFHQSSSLTKCRDRKRESKLRPYIGHKNEPSSFT